MARRSGFPVSNHSSGRINVKFGSGSARYQGGPGRQVQSIDQAGSGEEKRLAFGIRNRFRIRQWNGLRILVNSTDPIFVVQVRAGSQTRLPDESYDLREIHVLTAMQLWCKARQVTIDRHDSGAVLELYDV